MSHAIDPLKALDSLSWYAQMGVDLCVEETPQLIKSEEIRSAHPAAPSLARAGQDSTVSAAGTPFQQTLGQPVARHSSPATPPTSIAGAVAEARALADAAADLAALEQAVRNFTGCALKKTATNTVFAEGVPQSRLMFVGEAPGAEEDRSGVPFCGPSGKLLDTMLGFIGLTRGPGTPSHDLLTKKRAVRDTEGTSAHKVHDVPEEGPAQAGLQSKGMNGSGIENFYITNTLFWRPPGNRQPSAEELEICRPFVEKHIALVDPKILVLVGGTATSALLRDTRGITRLRGQVFSYTNQYMSREVPVHVIYHPSYLLRQPLAKKQAWADLLKLKEALRDSQ